MAQTIDLLCPDSREKSLAMTHLQETLMWANTAIACNQTEVLGPEWYARPWWINVNDRLPQAPDDDWVLVRIEFVPEGYCGVPHIAELRNGVWYSSGLKGPLEETLSVKVTHWMPIPNPGIEDDQKDNYVPDPRD
jgi:hypothetical protein